MSNKTTIKTKYAAIMPKNKNVKKNIYLKNVKTLKTLRILNIIKTHHGQITI